MKIVKTFALLAMTLASQPLAAQEVDDVYYFGQALYEDWVFDQDVVSVDRALKRRYGGLSGRVLVGHHGGPVKNLSDEEAAAALSEMAHAADDDQDLIVVMLTSHGDPGLLSVLHPGMDEAEDLSARSLRRMLKPLENDRHVVILQACYSGSLIPALHSPNRIIVTASRGDRASFDCDPDESNTWFIRSLVEEMRQGGSWQDVFSRTRERVLNYEQNNGIGASERSHPQFWVGEEMQSIWEGADGSN